ncbi:hypothetical protein [Sphingobacterium sp. UBA5670]|uniref:hypothetical protein n=1 Tax=Sphingobacterium sp. UBA5670 TaxID=1947502 RepID=UPI0025FF09EE|nr:hypothetical protein [Sphingobacterium sp. UBA5670]
MLVNAIKTRRRKLEDTSIQGNTIILRESRIHIAYPPDWQCLDPSIFEEFKLLIFSDVFLALEQWEKRKVWKAIYAPQFILQNSKNGINSFAVCYIFDKVALTGSSNLSLRSLVKMEQMWSGHLLKFVDSLRTNPKSIIINSYLACVSGNRSFAINNRNQQNIRILMVEFDHLILTFYLIEPILPEGMESSVQELINMISVGQC